MIPLARFRELAADPALAPIVEHLAWTAARWIGAAIIAAVAAACWGVAAGPEAWAPWGLLFLAAWGAGYAAGVFARRLRTLDRWERRCFRDPPPAWVGEIDDERGDA